MADRAVTPRWGMLFFEVLPYIPKKPRQLCQDLYGLNTSKTAASFSSCFSLKFLPFSDDALVKTTRSAMLFFQVFPLPNMKNRDGFQVCQDLKDPKGLDTPETAASFFVGER